MLTHTRTYIYIYIIIHLKFALIQKIICTNVCVCACVNTRENTLAAPSFRFPATSTGFAALSSKFDLFFYI